MTLTELLDQIQLRLGQNRNSTGWQAQRDVVLAFVANSAALLDEEFRDRLRFVPNVLIEGAQMGEYDKAESITTYKAPDDCDPLRIKNLSVKWSGLWHTLPRGISDNMRNYAYASTPTFIAWDVIECGEIEVWPHPTEFHEIRISYTRKANKYYEEEGCVDMDPELLIMLTLSAALPHYGRDGTKNDMRLNKHLGNIKAKQLDNVRYNKAHGNKHRQGTPDYADMVYTTPYAPGSSV